MRKGKGGGGKGVSPTTVDSPLPTSPPLPPLPLPVSLRPSLRRSLASHPQSPSLLSFSFPPSTPFLLHSLYALYPSFTRFLPCPACLPQCPPPLSLSLSLLPFLSPSVVSAFPLMPSHPQETPSLPCFFPLPPSLLPSLSALPSSPRPIDRVRVHQQQAKGVWRSVPRPAPGAPAHLLAFAPAVPLRLAAGATQRRGPAARRAAALHRRLMAGCLHHRKAALDGWLVGRSSLWHRAAGERAPSSVSQLPSPGRQHKRVYPEAPPELQHHPARARDGTTIPSLGALVEVRSNTADR